MRQRQLLVELDPLNNKEEPVSMIYRIAFSHLSFRALLYLLLRLCSMVDLLKIQLVVVRTWIRFYLDKS